MARGGEETSPSSYFPCLDFFDPTAADPSYPTGRAVHVDCKRQLPCNASDLAAAARSTLVRVRAHDDAVGKAGQVSACLVLNFFAATAVVSVTIKMIPLEPPIATFDAKVIETHRQSVHQNATEAMEGASVKLDERPPPPKRSTAIHQEGLAPDMRPQAQEATALPSLCTRYLKERWQTGRGEQRLLTFRGQQRKLRIGIRTNTISTERKMCGQRRSSFPAKENVRILRGERRSRIPGG